MAGNQSFTDLSLSDLWQQAKRETDPAYKASQAQGPEPLVQYQANPLGFLVEKLGIPLETLRWSANPEYLNHQWDGTPDPLEAIMVALASGQNVAVESATGTGKSFLAAGGTLWFLGCWRNARVMSYAPKEDQLRQFMWAEMGKLWPAFKRLFPSATMNDLALYMTGSVDPEARALWSARGMSVAVRAGETSATKAQGIHAEHMLLLLEEVPGIPPAIIDALENTCTAPHNLRWAQGNPDAKTDSLHALFQRPSWRSVRISALDHPNVVTGDSNIVPGAVSPKSIADRLEKYGEDHPQYQSRVRGIPPDESKDALIKLAWVERAIAKAKEWGPTLLQKRWPGALGADPSQSLAGDPAAIAHFIGPICVSVTAKACPNATHFGTEVWLIAERLDVAPQHIGVDPIGIGAATVNELRMRIPEGSYLPRLEFGGKPVTRAAKPGEGAGWVIDANLFGNLRSQVYWQFAQDAQHGRVGLPDDPELTEELICVEYEIRGGKVWMEDKNNIRVRLGRSPNKADAVVLANWVRSRTTPLDTALPKPDQHDLGLKKVNGKFKPMTAEDKFVEVNRIPVGVARKRWWK